MAAETTNNRRWWAPIGLRALLCIGCCAAPLLVAAGAVSGGVVLTSLSWLEPLGYVLIVAGAAGLLWSRLHRSGTRRRNLEQVHRRSPALARSRNSRGLLGVRAFAAGADVASLGRGAPFTLASWIVPAQTRRRHP